MLSAQCKVQSESTQCTLCAVRVGKCQIYIQYVCVEIYIKFDKRTPWTWYMVKNAMLGWVRAIYLTSLLTYMHMLNHLRFGGKYWTRPLQILPPARLPVFGGLAKIQDFSNWPLLDATLLFYNCFIIVITTTIFTMLQRVYDFTKNCFKAKVLDFWDWLKVTCICQQLSSWIFTTKNFVCSPI